MPVSRTFDVLIAGAGPAGIAAACAAAASPLSVGVVDDHPAAGGQIWRGQQESTEDRKAARTLRAFNDSGAKLIPQTRIFDVREHGIAVAGTGSECVEIRYDKLIVCTGARELFLPFPGWTLPNVVGAGGLQALVKGGLPVEGKRVVVAGSGPLLLAVGAYLRRQGARIAVIAEQAPFGRVARFALTLARDPEKLFQALGLRRSLSGLRYETGCRLVSASGNGQVERVVLETRVRTWSEPCDYLACGFGLVPNTELAQLAGCSVRDGCVETDEWQETSVAGVYCAGEPTGTGGVDLALVEGEIAGHAAAGHHAAARRSFGRRARGRRFQAALDRAFGLRERIRPLPPADTIVCRCEDVRLGQLLQWQSWRAAKLQTRCGMGACQGRICGPAVRFLLGWTPGSVRPPVFPASAEHLCGPEK